MNRVEKIVGRPKPLMAKGNFNVYNYTNDTIACLSWMDRTNAEYYLEYYVKNYSQFTFFIVELHNGKA